MDENDSSGNSPSKAVDETRWRFECARCFENVVLTNQTHGGKVICQECGLRGTVDLRDSLPGLWWEE